MHKRSLFPSILAVALVGVACPSKTDNNDDGGNNDDTITINNVTKHYVTAQCEHEIRCATEYALGDLTQAECETLLSADMGDGPDPTLYSINETAARACLDKVAAAPCGEHFDPDFDADCRAATVGSLTTGSCCDHRGGCGPGLRCDITDPNTGTCVAASAASGDCNEDTDCELGLFCDKTTHTCATLVQSGGDCTRDEQCAHTVCNDGTCGLSAVNGGSCANVVCFEMSWLSCVAGTEQCTPWAGLGQTCDNSEDAAPRCNLFDDLWCDNGTCAALPTLGNDCSATDACAGDSYCDGSTCVAFGGLGDDCGFGAFCDPSLYCDYALVGGDDTCKTLLGEGQTCNPLLNGTDCDDRLELDCGGTANTCVPRQAACQ